MKNSGRPNKHALRPLFWWIVLVLLLFGIRTHQRLMEQTRLEFAVTMQGQAINATATFDGKPAISGQNIPLGNHTFVVSYPIGDTFATNLFVWYGGRNFGTIDLKRQMGTLSVTADPPAPLLSISGPEWAVTLTNSSGLTKSVPTDQYTVESRYAHWTRADVVTVFQGTTANWRIAPQLGAAQLSCNQTDATFQLLTPENQPVEAGGFPALIAELPAGHYQLISQHHGHQHEQALTIVAGKTNACPIDFLYGAAVLDTEPPAAFVQGRDGHVWGETPLRLPELEPGTLQFTLHRSGYEPVLVSLEITAHQTSLFSTNLISKSYTGQMQSAHQAMEASDYDQALQALRDALIAKPADAEAQALQREATGLREIQLGQKLAEQGDYIGGEKDLKLALESLPDNAEARQLLTSFKVHEPEQIERERVERLNRPRTVYNDIVAHYPDANLFDDHELKTGKPADEAAAAIAQFLQRVKPGYQILVNKSPKPETYFLLASQTDTGILTTSGRRLCIIVCGQATDKDTEILYKVLEYTAKHNVSMQGLLAFKDNEEFIPISKSKISDLNDKLIAQLQSGVSNLTVRIQMAIGQTPTGQPTNSP